jgi:hypothetical protein
VTAFDRINAERERQCANGDDAQHDDQHDDQSLARCAALIADPFPNWAYNEDSAWPDGEAAHIRKKYKGDRQHQLVVAAALLVAEIERLDRRASPR